MTEFPPRHVVCAGLIVRRSDRYLFVRQTYGSLAGRWSIPWGFVDAGESPAAAAERECLEEAGVRAEANGLVGVQVLPGSVGGLGFVFEGRSVVGDEPEQDHRETDAARYLSAEDLNQLPVDRWCQWAVQQVANARTVSLGGGTGSPYEMPAWFVGH